MKRIELDSLLCRENASIKEAMRIIDNGGLSIAFVVDDQKKLLGTVTDGDIRKAIMQGTSLEKNISEVMNKSPIVASDSENFILSEDMKEKMSITPGYSFKIPVVDSEGRIKDVILFYQNKRKSIASSAVKTEHVKSVLVVGGAGYLGSLIVKKLLNKNYRVRILDNLSYESHGIEDLMKNQNLEFIKGDMRDIKVLTHAIKDIDAVIHLAGIVGDPACSKDPKETLEINLFSTKILAEMCKYYQINRFVFASTCSVYGASASEKELDENSALNPVSLYAESKLTCEKMLLEMMDENFSPVIFRMGTLYGASPRMRFDLVINLLTAKATVDKEITVFGGDQWRPFIHVDDAAEYYVECMEIPLEKIRGQIFNIGSANYKILEVAKIINSDIPDSKLAITEQVNDKRDYKTSFKKANFIFKFKPKKTINDAVKEIKNMPDVETYKNGIYHNDKYVKLE